jgi:hypothetical protein
LKNGRDQNADKKVKHRGRLGKRRFRERIGRSDGAAELGGYDNSFL